MLGVFLQDLLTRQQTNHANIIAMLVSTAVCIVLLLLLKWEKINPGWSWLIVIGTGITFIISVTSRRIMAFIK
jgi:MFS superfamily sulfate permease-like transporter